MRGDARALLRRVVQIAAVLAVANALALGALALFTRVAHAGPVVSPAPVLNGPATDGDSAPAQGEVRAAAPAAAAPVVEWGGVLDLQKRLKDVPVEHDASGTPYFVLETPEGKLRLTPEEFAERLAEVQEGQRANGFLYVLFNITTPLGFVWVALGFLGRRSSRSAWCSSGGRARRRSAPSSPSGSGGAASSAG